jgi:predicted MFS family arabinose efflux permease
MSKTAKAGRGTLFAIALVLILLAGQAMASMDGEILVIAAPSLRADLHASSAQLQLIVAMYTLAFGALVVTGARLGDVLGHRRAFLLGLTAFTLASLAGGLAPTPSVLIGAVAVQGAAAALMTPQVLSIIQLQFAGERRARAIGAYSMVLAAGVATGIVLGGLLVTAHLLAAAWRPALLLNVPVGAVVLLGARRLPKMAGGAQVRLDPAGAAALSAALLALVVPVTFGRDAGWPLWVWPCLAGCALALVGFVGLERRIAARGDDPLFDLDVLRLPGLAAGVGAVALVMACYTGFLVSLTLHLQGSLGFSALQAGLIFTAYASGFATASLTWTRASMSVRDRLPVAGPLVMAAALLAVGLIARGGGWPAALMTPLLLGGGAAHACAFSPLAARLTTVVRAEQAADLSGLMLSASLVGQVVGVALFGGVYLGAAPHGSAHAFALTTVALAVALVGVAGCACLARKGSHSLKQRLAGADREVTSRGGHDAHTSQPLRPRSRCGCA